MYSKRGMTLIEVVIAMFILALVIGGAFAVYLSNMRIYKSETKTAETQISKLMAIELLRKDIVHAGYGLPLDVGGISYNEATAAEADDYNDAPNNAPRAFVLGDNAKNGSDYLVIKSVKAAENDATRKWAFFTYNGSSAAWSFQGEEGGFDADDRTIFLRAMPPNEKALFEDGGVWSWTDQNYSPNISIDVLYLVYGLTSANVTRMPFNRVDYYLDSDELPQRCCPTTYVLKRATINHANGARNAQPILDCVRDFQVSFGLDTDNDTRIDTWSSTLPTTAAEIRRQVKEVRVFILYQEGQLLDHEASTATLSLGDANTGVLSTFTPSDGGFPGNCVEQNEKCYRWKILKLAVRPMNLGD